jgi:hypothetical protein
MPGKVSIGANINKEERNRPYIKIGSMLVMLEESKDSIDIIHAFQGCGVHSIRVICGLKSIQSQNHKIWKTLNQFGLRSVQPDRLRVNLP